MLSKSEYREETTENNSRAPAVSHEENAGAEHEADHQGGEAVLVGADGARFGDVDLETPGRHVSSTSKRSAGRSHRRWR